MNLFKKIFTDAFCSEKKANSKLSESELKAKRIEEKLKADKAIMFPKTEIKINELKQLLGNNISVESISGDRINLLADRQGHYYLDARNKYILKLTEELYDRLVKAERVFTDFVHFGDDFYKFGLIRESYISGITGNKMYFTNEIIGLIREAAMAEIFTKKIEKINEDSTRLLTDMCLSRSYKYIDPKYSKDEYIHFKPVFRKIHASEFKSSTVRLRQVPQFRVNTYSFIGLQISDWDSTSNCTFERQACNSEIIEKYREMNKYFMFIENYIATSSKTAKNISLTGIQSPIENKFFDFIYDLISYSYDEHTANKLCSILKYSDSYISPYNKESFGRIGWDEDANDRNLKTIFLTFLEQFSFLYVQGRSSAYSPEFRAILTGDRGETRLSKHLELFDDEFIILDNLTIGFNGRTAECDSILITKFGIFVAECKNFGTSGNFSIDISKDGSWSRNKDGTIEGIDRSPTLQNLEHAQILRRALKERIGDDLAKKLEINDFVVISNDTVQLNNQSSQAVLRISSVYSHINSFKEVLTHEEMIQLKDLILECTTEPLKYPYFDYKEEFTSLFKGALTELFKAIECEVGFEKIVDEQYSILNNAFKRKQELIKEFCKVEAQLSYIYKNYENLENPIILSDRDDPFVNGEFDQSLDRFLIDSNLKYNMIDSWKNDYTVEKQISQLIPGDLKGLNSIYHNKYLSQLKTCSWDISERYFYPKTNPDNTISWSDNYLAKFIDLEKPSDMPGEHGNLASLVAYYGQYKGTTFDRRFSMLERYTNSLVANIALKSRFNTYYFKPKHIYKESNTDLGKLKAIKIGDCISIGESFITLNKRPIYGKSTAYFKFTDGLQFIKDELPAGTFELFEIDRTPSIKRSELFLDNQNWFSLIYDNNMQIKLNSYTIFENADELSMMNPAFFRNSIRVINKSMSNDFSRGTTGTVPFDYEGATTFTIRLDDANNK